MSLVIQVRHPLIQHHLARLRDRQTESDEFRRLLERLSVLLAYEATQDLKLQSQAVVTPIGITTGQVLRQRIGLFPILRAGLGMVEPVLHLIPSAQVWHLGLYRDERTARPVEYYQKLPASNPVDVALLLDPMLATGGSALAALAALYDWGVPQVKLLSVIAAQPGVEAVVGQFPQTSIYVCAIDSELNAQKFIVPGLGDAGDRIFNTPRQEP